MDILDLGMIDFREFLRIQAQYVNRRIEGCISDTMLLAEHPLTVSFNVHNADAQLPFLRKSREWFYARRIPIIGITRGGSLAVHAPGILGCYFIARIPAALELFDFLSRIKNMAREVLSHMGLDTCELPEHFRHGDDQNRKKYSGLWVETRKIVSIAISARGGGALAPRLRDERPSFTRFGINIHINPETDVLRLIHPCSITEYELTSVALEGRHGDVRHTIALIQQIAPKYFQK